LVLPFGHPAALSRKLHGVLPSAIRSDQDQSMQFLRWLVLVCAPLAAPMDVYAQGASAVDAPANTRNVILFLANAGGVSTQ
jgi:hypothetical protein